MNWSMEHVDELEHRHLQHGLEKQRSDMLAVAVQWKKQS